MSNIAHIAADYIATWNETDAARRDALLAAGWNQDASYIDPMAQGRGHKEIGALIGAVQARFPGFHFALDGEPDGYGRHLRFSWTLGPAGESDMIKGTDFAVIENGRFKSVTGFLDKVPAVA